MGTSTDIGPRMTGGLPFHKVKCLNMPKDILGSQELKHLSSLFLDFAGRSSFVNLGEQTYGYLTHNHYVFLTLRIS